ncbi:ABC transporter permease [Christensenellaceae bacterium OttesenSCG-928-L17]|nr:ABC transporter permease [Christensenellaceae bacterium OttesenSCG-928-L17]
MSFKDMLSIGFMNLWRRRLRTFLTVLGMMIGTASIVVMVSLGIGMNEVTTEIFESYGSLTTINVWNSSYVDPESSGNTVYSQQVTLDDKVVAAIRKIPGVAAVMPLVETGAYIKTGQYVSYISIIGVDPTVAEEFGFELAEGRLHNANTGTNYEIVFGSYMLQNFYHPRTGKPAIDQNGNSKISLEKSRFQMTFDYRNVYDYGDMGGEASPLGKTYRVNVVGTLADGNNSWYSLMDIAALKRLYRENKEHMHISDSSYYEVWVKCDSADVVLDVQDQIHNLGFMASSLQDGLKVQQEMQSSTQMLLGAIGAVSLLIAAIGIMNTMMMSIYERTKEIGIMKVLGCRMGSIAKLFLVEAAYIGLFGGALGLGISYGVSVFFNSRITETAMMRSVIPPYLAVGAVVFSMVVALVSGLYPAIRAMRLSALTALRSE